VTSWPSHEDEDDFAPLDLNATVEHAIRLVEPELQHANIQLKKRYAVNLPSVLGNRSQLQQVLLNLVFNAKDAMPEGGSLTLGTETKDGQVLLSCSDTGLGIPHQQLNLVFDPFFTTKEVGKGVGLGLYVCQRIVQEHRGRIEVESTVGRGTTFTVSLPLAEETKGNK
jgi:signal transduction histidine kinase